MTYARARSPVRYSADDADAAADLSDDDDFSEGILYLLFVSLSSFSCIPPHSLPTPSLNHHRHVVSEHVQGRPREAANAAEAEQE